MSVCDESAFLCGRAMRLLDLRNTSASRWERSIKVCPCARLLSPSCIASGTDANAPLLLHVCCFAQALDHTVWDFVSPATFDSVLRADVAVVAMRPGLLGLDTATGQPLWYRRFDALGMLRARGDYLLTGEYSVLSFAPGDVRGELSRRPGLLQTLARPDVYWRAERDRIRSADRYCGRA